MKLTQKQQEVVNKFNELENEHGKGNVYIRWINDYWNIMFVTHKKGDSTVGMMLKDENKINGTIFNSLEKKGLLQPTNINHEIGNPNDFSIPYVGCKIILQ